MVLRMLLIDFSSEIRSEMVFTLLKLVIGVQKCVNFVKFGHRDRRETKRAW